MALTADELAALGNAIGAAVAAAAPAAPAAPPVAAAAGGAGGTRKVPTFSEADDPIEWTTWRAKFEMLATIQGWDDLRKRRELFAAMSGAAARAVADIVVVDPPAPAAGHPAGFIARTYDLVIQEYEARFITTAASEMSRSEFAGARQLTDESLLEWSARCRSLYMRAYPGANPQGAGDAGLMLRERFIKGLDNDVLKEYVWDHRPANFGECLTHAENKMATLTMMADTATAGRKKRDTQGGVHQLGQKEKDNRNRKGCFLCKEEGHFVRNCPKLEEAQEAAANKGKKNKKRFFKKKVAALEAEEEEENSSGDAGN